MGGFEWNKIAMAGLLSLLVLKSVDLISEGLIAPKYLDKNVYVVEGVEAKSGDGAAAEEKLAPIEPLLASANVQKGQEISKKCLQCHTFEAGGASKTGPNLHNIVDQPQGKKEGYTYSAAFKELKGNWDVETLNKFLHKPRSVASGTKMSFAGLKTPEERRDVIAYLKTLKS